MIHSPLLTFVFNLMPSCIWKLIVFKFKLTCPMKARVKSMLYDPVMCQYGNHGSIYMHCLLHFSSVRTFCKEMTFFHEEQRAVFSEIAMWSSRENILLP